jgi:hypothetical protein
MAERQNEGGTNRGRGMREMVVVVKKGGFDGSDRL